MGHLVLHEGEGEAGRKALILVGGGACDFPEGREVGDIVERRGGLAEIDTRWERHRYALKESCQVGGHPYRHGGIGGETLDARRPAGAGPRGAVEKA